MDKTKIAKGLVALTLIAAVFVTGLYFGRTGGPGDFTVTTQYAIGAVDQAELGELARQVAARAERAETPDEPTAPAMPAPLEPDDGRININTAEVDRLMTLPGIGPVMAERIIAHREVNGPFRIIEEITDVSGIGPARFSDIRELITVE